MSIVMGLYTRMEETIIMLHLLKN